MAENAETLFKNNNLTLTKFNQIKQLGRISQTNRNNRQHRNIILLLYFHHSNPSDFLDNISK